MSSRVAKAIITLLIAVPVFLVSVVAIWKQTHQMSSPVLMKFEDLDLPRQMVSFPNASTSMEADHILAWAEGKPFEGVNVIFNRQKGGGIGVPKSCELTMKADFWSPTTVTSAVFEKIGDRTYQATFPKVSCQGSLLFRFAFDGPTYGKHDGSYHFDVSLVPIDTSVAPINIELRFFQCGSTDLTDLN